MPPYKRTWPEDHNPFLRRPTPVFGRLKIVALLPLALLRSAVAVSTLLLLVAAMSVVNLVFGSGDVHPPNPHRRASAIFLTRLAARILLLCMGYWYIPVTRVGSWKDADQPVPAVVIGNHVSYVEILWTIAYSRWPVTFVSKIENSKLPVIGTLIKGLYCILVDRKAGTKAAMDSIVARLQPENRAHYPTLCMFPEGTTTTGRCVIRFKRGAFVAGQPVKPYFFKFPETGFDPCFSCHSSLPLHWLGMTAQPFNKLQVLELPMYVPTAEEKADPTLFANNVRALMAKTGGVETHELQWEDKVPFDPKYNKGKKKGLATVSSASASAASAATASSSIPPPSSSSSSSAAASVTGAASKPVLKASSPPGAGDPPPKPLTPHNNKLE